MANSKSISAAGNATSDLVSCDPTAIERLIQMKCDNNGTAASGDTVTWKLLASLGDPDADPDSADEFTTQENAAIVAILSTYENSAAIDPAISNPVALPLGLSAGFKLYALNNAASNAITVSATMTERLEDGTFQETQITWT